MFFYGMFYSLFLGIFSLNVKICLLGGGLGTRYESKHFRGFLEVFYFPKVLSLKLFSKLWGTSYIHFQLVII